MCRLPLTNLLSLRHKTLRSVSLAQHLRWKMSDEDLTYIGTAVPYLTDLAITPILR
jgi:hypothetical protein